MGTGRPPSRAPWPHTGAVLVGGASRRMGSPKVAKPLPGGLTLGETAVRCLEAVCLQVVVAGDSPHLPPSLRRLPVLPDNRAGCGPLGGVEALLKSGIDATYLVLPCDLPFMLHSILTRLVGLAGDGAAVCRLEGAGSFEPFPLVVPSSAHPVLARALESGSFTVRRFIDEISPRILDLPSGLQASFWNVNGPVDLPGNSLS